MIYPCADKLEVWGSKYSLVILAAQRAKQIKYGANPLIETDSPNPLTIALEEIAAGAVSYTVPDTDLPPTPEISPEEVGLTRTLDLADEDGPAPLDDSDIKSAETLVVDEEDEEEDDDESETDDDLDSDSEDDGRDSESADTDSEFANEDESEPETDESED